MSKFSVHSHDGATVALHEHVEDALQALRRIDTAEKVLRVSDGEQIASKTRFGKPKPVLASVMS